MLLIGTELYDDSDIVGCCSSLLEDSSDMLIPHVSLIHVQTAQLAL
jgi:hypothetical protein